MIVERIAQRRMRAFLAGFERKDFAAMSRVWADDITLEFPPGLPMAGKWQGIGKVQELFEAVFAHNRSFRATLDRVSVLHPWSLSGRSTVITEWHREEESHDGHRLRTRVVSVSETRRWRGVSTRDYFWDVPAVAAHYASMPLPRRAEAAVPSSDVQAG